MDWQPITYIDNIQHWSLHLEIFPFYIEIKWLPWLPLQNRPQILKAEHPGNH